MHLSDVWKYCDPQTYNLCSNYELTNICKFIYKLVWQRCELPDPAQLKSTPGHLFEARVCHIKLKLVHKPHDADFNYYEMIVIITCKMNII